MRARWGVPRQLERICPGTPTGGHPAWHPHPMRPQSPSGVGQVARPHTGHCWLHSSLSLATPQTQHVCPGLSSRKRRYHCSAPTWLLGSVPAPTQSRGHPQVSFWMPHTLPLGAQLRELLRGGGPPVDVQAETPRVGFTRIPQVRGTETPESPFSSNRGTTKEKMWISTTGK